MHKFLCPALLVFGTLVLSGCPSALSNLGPGNRNAALPVEPGAQTSGEQRMKLPYAIQASNRGAFTEFTIHNQGDSDLPVAPGDIAMLVSESRQQVHYDPREVLIDLPLDHRIPPGQSVTGRARYNAFPNPTGNRLVFNPGADPKGRFAVVTTIQ